jgi:hypothetical protein
VRSLLALTFMSALTAIPALFIACGGDDDDGSTSGDDSSGDADSGVPDSGGGTQADAGSSPADAAPGGDSGSGSGDFGPECQRYLACCEVDAPADECEAAIEAGGSDPDQQEMFCKIAADAAGCP